MRSPGKFSGNRRIYKSNVLDHEDRVCIYNTICEKPGIDLTTIAVILEFNPNTLRYHLKMLEFNGKIIAMREQGIVRYYENHARYSALERRLIRYLWSPTSETLLQVLKSGPDSSQIELALQLGTTVPTLRWHIQRFLSDGIVSVYRDGRSVRYRLTEEAEAILCRIQVAEKVTV